MNLINIYKKSLTIIFSNPAITLFLVLFLILSNIMSTYLQNSKVNAVALVLFLCVLMLSLCFTSGWLQVAKEATSIKKEENKNYFGIFFEGIGKNIFSVGIGMFIYTFLLIIAFIIIGKIAHHSFGSLSFLQTDLSAVPQDNKSILNYFENLSMEKNYIISSWLLSFFLGTTLFNFIMLFYFPAIIFSNIENDFLKPFVALKDNLCFLFKNFFGSLGVYITIFSLYLLIMTLNTLFSANAIISILVLLFYIYFISFALMLTFNYYEQRNNCNNGSDGIGQDEDFDKSCESN